MPQSACKGKQRNPPRKTRAMTAGSLNLYNTLTKKTEVFSPLIPGQVSLYVCGPTVYDRAHIGNARPVVVFDVLYRLLSLDHKVTYVKNITDIDDKIIAAAKENGESIDDLTQRFTAYYHQDMAELLALPPTHEPRATDHVGDMIAVIETLIAKGHAYEAEGHVLFDTPSDPTYGCLSNQPLEDMIAGARVEVAPYKKNPQDFVLWKPSSDDMPGWESPWGWGRPGWHIECSAMSFKHLGELFDIHGGGLDLCFPHHENELAQSTCAFGKGSFAQVWMHNGMLMVNGAKMSKSLGNFYTVQDLLAKGNGETIRFAILQSHYRQPLDWQDQTLGQAKAALDGLYTALEGFDEESDAAFLDADFLKALREDLNTPRAIARLHELAKSANKSKTESDRLTAQRALKASARLMGLLPQTTTQWFHADAQDGPSKDEIESLIEQRKNARLARDFAESDRIRDYLLTHHITLEDSPSGTIWKRR